MLCSGRGQPSITLCQAVGDADEAERRGPWSGQESSSTGGGRRVHAWMMTGPTLPSSARMALGEEASPWSGGRASRAGASASQGRSTSGSGPGWRVVMVVEWAVAVPPARRRGPCFARDEAAGAEELVRIEAPFTTPAGGGVCSGISGLRDAGRGGGRARSVLVRRGVGECGCFRPRCWLSSWARSKTGRSWRSGCPGGRSG
jgi:hypothetical protein